MLHETVPTMTVIRFGEPVRINVSDYDPKVDKLASDSPKPAVEPAVEPVQLGLVKKGRRYFVVNAITGESVEMDGVDSDGYTTEEAAIAAAQAAMVS